MAGGLGHRGVFDTDKYCSSKASRPIDGVPTLWDRFPFSTDVAKALMKRYISRTTPN